MVLIDVILASDSKKCYLASPNMMSLNYRICKLFEIYLDEWPRHFGKPRGSGG